jgi:hypothetical protein
MKYSLRSLMIGITLGCVMLGGRIEYLRQRAVFHEREATKHKPEIEPNTGIELWRIGELDARVDREQLAQKYRSAMLRPWTFVNESSEGTYP